MHYTIESYATCLLYKFFELPFIWLLITFNAVVTPVKMPKGHPGGIVAGV
jgi:hypothetical protein